MNDSKTIIYVKLRGWNECIQSAKIDTVEVERSKVLSVLHDMKDMRHLTFKLPNGSQAYIHPEDISYVIVTVIPSFTQKLKKLFTLGK